MKRLFGDAIKCYRHLEGAARIMKRVTTPKEMCSTALGRSLLGWYITFEDFVCFLAAYETQLPVEWRLENFRIRTELAREEYPHLSEDERLPRLLDDIWPKYWCYTMKLTNIICGIPKLKTIDIDLRSAAAAQLEADMREFHRNLEELLQSAEALEILQTTQPEGTLRTRHAKCCPQVPFEPTYLKFPPAGYFSIIAFGCQIYIRTLLHPALKDAVLQTGLKAEDLDGPPITDLADLLCKTFAGLEYAFNDTPDALFPCFPGLVIATLSCQPGYRDWLWYKFAHFEQMGGYAFAPIKRSLAQVSNMPEIVTEGFDGLKEHKPSKKPLPKPSYWTDPSFDELQSIMEKVKLDNADDPQMEG